MTIYHLSFKASLGDADKARSIEQHLKALADPFTDVHDEAVANIQHAALRRHLASLPALQRLIIVWHYGLAGPEMPLGAIAQKLNQPLSAVSAMHHRALHDLRDLLDLAA